MVHLAKHSVAPSLSVSMITERNTYRSPLQRTTSNPVPTKVGSLMVTLAILKLSVIVTAVLAGIRGRPQATTIGTTAELTASASSNGGIVASALQVSQEDEEL